MKYETPELTALMPAISAIQSVTVNKQSGSNEDGTHTIPSGCYEDSE